MNPIVLTAGPYRLVATPDGGGLLEFSIADGDDRRDILRPAGVVPSGPLDRAMIVMAPWCNRIGGGGFHVGGRFYAIAPNIPSFPLPLYGTAFQSRWEVIEQRIERLELRLDVSGSTDFNYRAELIYELTAAGLSVHLSVTNTGPDAMPFGIGLHPWFASSDHTRVQFHAGRQVLTDATGLPVQVSRLIENFSTPRTLPEGRIDNTFLDWDGTTLLQHETGTVLMRSTAPMLHVFSSSSSAGFCCLEPQTAMPNAANFEAVGGSRLAQGERISMAMSISCT